MNYLYNFFPSFNYKYAVSRKAGYGIAVVTSGVTLLVCLFLDQFFSGTLPLTPFILAVAVSAWFGGLRAGLLASLFGALASDYFLLEPQHGFTFYLEESSWERLVLFLATSVLMCGLIEAIRVGRREAEARAREAEQRQRELEAQVAERERAKAERERLIAELETERARLKAIVEHIPAGVLLAEAPGGRIVMGNPQAEQITGHKIIQSPDVSSYGEWRAYHPGGRRVDAREYPLARALEGEISSGEEFLYQRGDGKKIWIRISGAPIRDHLGRIVGGVVHFSDINEEKLAGEILRVNQERLRLAQKAARMGSFEWNIQTGEHIWSEEMQATYGLAPGSFGGAYEDWTSLLHPADRPRAEQDVQRALTEGEFTSEWRAIWPNGTIHWIQARGKVFYDNAGQPMRLLGVNIDVTERKQAEEELQSSERRLDVAMAAAQMGSWHMDFQTREMVCSAAFKANFGRAADETFTFEDLFNAIHPDDRGRVREAVRRAIHNREPYRSEHRVVWPDGGVHWILAHGRVSYGDDGQPLHLDGVTLDLSERKRMEESLRRQTESLREADRRKDEFLATLAHELRNPLAPISNAIQILAKRGDDPAVVAQTGEVMDRQVQQISRLVDDLLEVSRVGRGKISLQKAPVDLAEIVATAVETSRPLVEAHRHRLTISLPDRPLRVEADATRLAQVLSNLLNNAAKYTADGGRINLSVAQEQGQGRGEAVLRVRDNGIGIAPEMLSRVFDMFAQIEGDTDRSQGGLGIGLTLARRLVEMHGGKVEAFSRGLGEGSEFVVRLPMLTELVVAPSQSLTLAQADAGAPRAAESADTKCVLIVDDNPDSAESLATLLRLYGHEVRLAYDGPAALEEALAFRPDVVFLDLSLPKMDGYEVARRIRLEPSMRNVRLIAMTGYSQEGDRRRTGEAGFHLHLVKPVDFGILQDLLANVPSGAACQQRARGEIS